MSLKKLALALATVVAIALPALAQTPGATIAGRVVDATGLTVPGVTVTLQGDDIRRSLTSSPRSMDGYRFSISRRVVQDDRGASGLHDDRPRARHRRRRKVRGAPGADGGRGGGADRRRQRRAADRRHEGHGRRRRTSPLDELSKIPTSRDPFAIMRSVPGVLVDRVNIGGNETGQQPNFVSKGTRPQDAVWAMDGVAITDMALTGPRRPTSTTTTSIRFR